MARTLSPVALKAKALRSALKTELGLGRDAVSVTCDNFSMGSSISVEIKTMAVSKAEVEAIAKRFSRVDRCEVTGEILGGGNTYVDVAYSHSALKAAAAPLVPAIEALGKGLVSRVRFGSVEVVRHEKTAGFFRFYMPEFPNADDGFCSSPETTARQIVISLACAKA